MGSLLLLRIGLVLVSGGGFTATYLSEGTKVNVCIVDPPGKRVQLPVKSIDTIVASNDGMNVAICPLYSREIYVGSDGKKLRHLDLSTLLGPRRNKTEVRDGINPTFGIDINKLGDRAWLFFPEQREIVTASLTDGKVLVSPRYFEVAKTLPKAPWDPEGTSGCRIRVSPDSKSLVLSMGTKTIASSEADDHESGTWLISDENRKARFLGYGSPLAWVDAKAIALWQTRGDDGEVRIVNRLGQTIWSAKKLAAAAAVQDRIFVAYAGHGPVKRFLAFNSNGVRCPKDDISLKIGFKRHEATCLGMAITKAKPWHLGPQ